MILWFYDFSFKSEPGHTKQTSEVLAAITPGEWFLRVLLPFSNFCWSCEIPCTPKKTISQFLVLSSLWCQFCLTLRVKQSHTKRAKQIAQTFLCLSVFWLELLWAVPSHRPCRGLGPWCPWRGTESTTPWRWNPRTSASPWGRRARTSAKRLPTWSSWMMTSPKSCRCREFPALQLCSGCAVQQACCVRNAGGEPQRGSDSSSVASMAMDFLPSGADQATFHISHCCELIWDLTAPRSLGRSELLLVRIWTRWSWRSFPTFMILPRALPHPGSSEEKHNLQCSVGWQQEGGWAGYSECINRSQVCFMNQNLAQVCRSTRW